jgi:hypothetical protein
VLAGAPAVDAARALAASLGLDEPGRAALEDLLDVTLTSLVEAPSAAAAAGAGAGAAAVAAAGVGVPPQTALLEAIDFLCDASLEEMQGPFAGEPPSPPSSPQAAPSSSKRGAAAVGVPPPPAGGVLPPRALVYAPLDVALVRKPSAMRVGAAAATTAAGGVVAGVGLPALPLDPFAMAAALGRTPGDNALAVEAFLKANPSVLRNPHGSALPVPLAGAWGTLAGTGASAAAAAITAALRVAADRERGRTPRAAGAAGAGAAGAAGATATATTDALAVARDPWFPHGARGGFFNQGLQAWQDMRAAWRARTRDPVMAPPPYPPAVDEDEVIDELCVQRREYTLPGPMRLPDMIDLMQEVWEIEADEVAMGIRAPS